MLASLDEALANRSPCDGRPPSRCRSCGTSSPPCRATRSGNRRRCGPRRTPGAPRPAGSRVPAPTCAGQMAAVTRPGADDDTTEGTRRVILVPGARRRAECSTPHQGTPHSPSKPDTTPQNNQEHLSRGVPSRQTGFTSPTRRRRPDLVAAGQEVGPWGWTTLRPLTERRLLTESEATRSGLQGPPVADGRGRVIGQFMVPFAGTPKFLTCDWTCSAFNRSAHTVRLRNIVPLCIFSAHSRRSSMPWGKVSPISIDCQPSSRLVAPYTWPKETWGTALLYIRAVRNISDKLYR